MAETDPYLLEAQSISAAVSPRRHMRQVLAYSYLPPLLMGRLVRMDEQLL